jgi:phosphate:Na+ symporter
VLEKLACLTVRDKPGEDEDELEEDTLDERFLVTPNVAIAQTSEAVVSMGIQAQKNFKAVVELYDNIDDFDPKLAENIREREETIDRLEDRVGQYLIKLNDCGLNEDESRRVTAYFHLISEFERIGDYTINILETAEALYDAEVSFSNDARRELKITFAAIEEIISLAIKATQSMEIEDMIQVEPLEEVVDRIVEDLKSIHINRAKSGVCKVDVGVHFIDILTNVERISDHCSNIAVYLLASREEYSTLKKHEYLEKLHKNGTKTYEERLEEYSRKYAIS